MANFSPAYFPVFRAFDANGNPLAGGKLFSYAAGTTTPLATYTDATGGTPNTNPVELDANGEAQVWLGSDAYKFVLQDATGSVLWTADGIKSLDELAANYADALLRADLANTADPAKGDALVGGKRTLAGAVAFTGHGYHQNRVVNVKTDFGAVGDGTTDDTAAIQAAIDSLPLNSGPNYSPKGFSQGGAIFIPAGRYKIASRIKLKRGIHIFGESRESTQIISFSTSGVFYYEDDGRYIQDELIIENISIWQDSTVTPVSGAAFSLLSGLSGTASSQIALKNILIEGTYYGFELLGALGSTIEGCNVTRTVSHGIKVFGSPTTTSTTVLNTYAQLCGGDGIHFETGSYVSMLGCASDSNGGFGYRVEAVQCCNMMACGAEQNTSGAAILKDSDSITISIRTACKADTDGVQISNCRKVVFVGPYFDVLAGSSTGYAVNVTVAGGSITLIGASYLGWFASNKYNVTTNLLDLDGTNGFVGSGDSWALGNPSRSVATDSLLSFSGNLGAAIFKGLNVTPIFTGADANRNALLHLQAITANTAVTYPGLAVVYVPAVSKGAASTITRFAAHWIKESSVGGTANVNLLIDATIGFIPGTAWDIYSDSTRASFFKAGEFRHLTTSGPLEKWGSGSPEGAVTAPVGSVFHRTDGGAGTCLYVKESGTGNTGWVAK